MGVSVVAVFAVTAVGFVVRFTPGSEPQTSEPSGRQGILIYSIQESFGWAKVEVLELASGTVIDGPEVFHPVAFVISAEEGSIGAVTRFEGRLQASLVDLLSSARSGRDPMASGEFVAWSVDGRSVFSAVTRGTGRCRRVRLRETGFGRSFTIPRVCGTLEGLSVDRGSNVYLTVHDDRRRDGLGWFIWLVRTEGGGFMREALADHRLLAASPSGELAVVPMRNRQAVSSNESSQILMFSDLRELRPLPAGTPSARMIPERVLGWTPNEGDAYVLGTYAGTRGVFLVPSRGEPGELLPELVFETPATEVAMTQTLDGTAFFSAGGLILVYEGGVLSTLDLPDETPRPAGPMLWLPALPYSGV